MIKIPVNNPKYIEEKYWLLISNIIFKKIDRVKKTVTKLYKKEQVGVCKNPGKALNTLDEDTINYLYISFRSKYEDIKSILKCIVLLNVNDISSFAKQYDKIPINSCKSNNYIYKIFKNEELMKYIFNYDNFVTFCAYDFVKLIGIKLCPYCNIDYIFTATADESNTGTRPDLDHFFPESKYPWLALSLYNLIPSCKVCNTKKLDKVNHDFLNPYKEGLVDSFTFKAFPNNIDSLISYNLDNDYEVILDHNDNEHVNAQDKELLITKRYNNFSDIINEIKVKQVIYSNDYIENLVNQYDFISNFDDAYRLVWGNYYNAEDFHKRPLAKFTSDIINQFSNES